LPVPLPARRGRFSPDPSSAFGVYPPWRAVSAVKERRVPRPLFPVPRIPAVGRRLPFWQFPCPSSLGLPASGGFPVPRSPFPVPAFIALRTRNSFPRLGLQKQRMRGDCKSLFRLDLQKQVSPGFRFPVPGSPFPAFGSYAQRRMPIRACKKPSKTIKFESKSIKKATFSVKKRSKRRAFRLAHVNILGGHPLWR